MSTYKHRQRNTVLTWSNFKPPYFTVIWMFVAHASRLFSINSFKAFAGRLIISPAAIRFTTTGSSLLITPASNGNFLSILRRPHKLNDGNNITRQRFDRFYSWQSVTATDSYSELSKSYVSTTYRIHNIGQQQMLEGEIQIHDAIPRCSEWRINSAVFGPHKHTDTNTSTSVWV